MDDELLIAGLVRSYAEKQAPADDATAEHAIAVAVRAYGSGASIIEACSVGRHAVDAVRMAEPVRVRR